MSRQIFLYSTLISILIYLCLSFFIVKDYGIMIDDPEQFGVGHKNLNYCLTGQLNYQDDEPKIKNHPNFYNYIVKTRPHHIWPFTPMLSAATCKIFFEKLNWLSPVPAHHFIIPILTALFFLLFFFFMRKWWGNFATLCSVLLLITLPRFFGHSLSNIKDLPEVLFFSLTIMYFMDWYLLNRSFDALRLLRMNGQTITRTSGIRNFILNIINKFKHQPNNKTFTSKTKNNTPLVLSEVEGYQHTKYLYLSFIFFGLAFATKADAIFVIPILGLWLIPDLINGLIKNASIKLKTLFHFCIGGLISFLFIFFSYPQLQPWYYKSNYEFLVQAPKFIYTLARYVIGIGGDIDSTWNLYSIKQIFYTTPILILLFFVVGFAYILISLYIKHIPRYDCSAITRDERNRKKSQDYKQMKTYNSKNPLTLSATRSVVYRRVSTLLLIWLFLPILRHCMPKVNHYDGLRHFMVFMVPFIIITTIGIINFAKLISQKFKLKQNITQIIILIIVLIPNIYSVITLHPYQTTFYNKIIGGLGGAQKKEIPFSSDYWFNSNLEFGNWINKNAKQNANIYGPYINYYLNPSRRPSRRPSGSSGQTGNLKIISLDKNDKIPNNTYIVEIPRRWYRLDKKLPLISELIPEIKDLEIVYQIKRQNGIIGTIYYKN